ncbi:MAG: hypothetical protein ACRDIC_15475, partial [bacterium]
LRPDRRRQGRMLAILLAGMAPREATPGKVGRGIRERVEGDDRGVRVNIIQLTGSPAGQRVR